MGCSKHLCSAALLSSQQLSGEVADCTVKQVGAPFAAVYFSVFQIIKGNIHRSLAHQSVLVGIPLRITNLIELCVLRDSGRMHGHGGVCSRFALTCFVFAGVPPRFPRCIHRSGRPLARLGDCGDQC